MRKNNDRGVKKKTRRLVALLTVLGIGLGIMTAVLIAHIGEIHREESLVYAKDRKEATEILRILPERVSPQWLFYQSCAEENERAGEKENLDRLVNSWTKGKLTDDELAELLKEYYEKKQVTLANVGVQSNMLCLFPSVNELPDYASMLKEGTKKYAFIGVYTKGEYDEKGRVICYYWEVLVQ